MRKWLMNCWLVKCIKAVGDVILYILKELKSIKVITMVFLLILLCISIITKFDSVALQIVIPIVFGFLFHLRSQEKTSGKLLNGDENGNNQVNPSK